MDTNLRIELNKALAVIETMGRDLPTDEAYELYRHIGTRQELLRKRLSRDGAFGKKTCNDVSLGLLSPVEAIAS